MKNKQLKSVLMDHYETVAYALQYKPSDELKKITRRILELLLKVHHLEGSLDEAVSAVDSTARICTLADIALYDSTRFDHSDVDLTAYTFKVDAIAEAQLSRLSDLDTDLLLLRLERDAAVGQKNAAKLLACNCWLGLFGEKNQKKAVEIWKSLAICGDRAAAKMLIYALDSTGEADKARIWERTIAAVDVANDAFSPFVLPLGERLEKEEEVNAAIILAMTSKPKTDNSKFFDRNIAYYLLYSSDPLELKLDAIRGDISCTSRVYSENRYKNKKYGF